jgi:NarL family two-component system response regulator LiaR
MKKIRVMIVDDHSIVRMGLAAILDLEKDLAVCGTAESGAEAVDAALRLKPDVIVMDLMMPDLDGAEATAAIRKVLPDAKILILTTFGTSRELSRAVSAGATGAVTKNIANAELVAAIHDTAEGRPHFSPEIRQALDDTAGIPDFTPRQMEVLKSITRGLSNDDIARQLGLSKTRIKQHLNEIYEKLGAANRAEAVAIAIHRELLKN